MKNIRETIFTTVFLISALLSCSPDSNGPSSLDTSIAGLWHGAIGAISLENTQGQKVVDFKGDKISVAISPGDSSFFLVTRDTTRGDSFTIKDTTLILSGGWLLNAQKDSILLLCDSCRVVDTTLNILSPRQVQGQVIPVATPIERQPDGTVLWHVCLYDLSPLMPYIGLNLSGIPPDMLKTLLSGTIIDLEKTSP